MPSATKAWTKSKQIDPSPLRIDGPNDVVQFCRRCSQLPVMHVFHCQSHTTFLTFLRQPCQRFDRVSQPVGSFTLLDETSYSHEPQGFLLPEPADS